MKLLSRGPWLNGPRELAGERRDGERFFLTPGDGGYAGDGGNGGTSTEGRGGGKSVLGRAKRGTVEGEEEIFSGRVSIYTRNDIN